jgi:phosphoglycerate dehydrogenase-like enzyme/glyoxylase-like metal-dependent hydrolase (beta-lactamase superfamily II)
MRMGAGACVLFLAVVAGGATAAAAEPAVPMKFNEVKEVAPGVFFRYSSISATDKSIPFGGSNNIWVVFDDYVAVIDANFPKEAGDVVEAIKKTTDKPIRYVLDTHHHGDHAYGNAVFAKSGATVVAQTNCARLLRIDGPKDFAEAGRGPTGREDVRNSQLKVPSLVFDDKLVLDDGKQRVEFLFRGHAHTAGDAFAYLPRHKILCTGDACVNGAYNFMGHSDSASWIRVLERVEQLDVKMVCPGHGPIGGKELLEKQKRYFVGLRRQVRAGIDAGKDLDDIIKSINMPWYKEWTGTTPAVDNIKHVYAELTGRIQPWDLVEDFGVLEGPSPNKDTPGWKAPRRIVVPNLMPARLAELKRIAPEVLFIRVKTAADAVREVAEADAVLGFCTPEIVSAGKNLRWIQVGSGAVEHLLSPELVRSPIVLTDTQGLAGPSVADQALALLLKLSRGVGNGPLDSRPPTQPHELHGQTMLLLGLGGDGKHIARRAHACGMRVLAVDGDETLERPDYVFSIDRPVRLDALLPKADVVVIACPMTAETRGLIGAAQFKAMKRSAYLINIAGGGIVKTADLVAALKSNSIAGAGLDAVDPARLPGDHELRKLPNVVMTPQVGGQSDGARDRQWRLWRENVRRFAAGERLLCVVDKHKGID